MMVTNLLSVPIFTRDFEIFGLLAFALFLIFYTKSLPQFSKFYKYVPALLLAYFLPAAFNFAGLIQPEWETVVDGEIISQSTQTYFVASRYLLPAALILMTINIDLKGIINLGPKALIMFSTATLGIVVGGPVAVLIVGSISPETIGGEGPLAVWRGLATLAGSWIGGGANQAAMLEIYQYDQEQYGGMVLVDILVANVLLAAIILGIGYNKQLNRWLKADDSSINRLKDRMAKRQAEQEKIPHSYHLLTIVGLVFAAIGLAHFLAQQTSDFLLNNFEVFSDPSSVWSSFANSFFWLVTYSSVIGVLLSFTRLRELENYGASKIGTVFIYILVATIGMKIEFGSVFDNPGLLAIGFIWILIHGGLLLLVAKWIRAPYFFVAVGSQANVGGAASAPIVASEFHSTLAAVGVLLAILGYAVGTVSAIACAELMRMASSV